MHDLLREVRGDGRVIALRGGQLLVEPGGPAPIVGQRHVGVTRTERHTVQRYTQQIGIAGSILASLLRSAAGPD